MLKIKRLFKSSMLESIWFIKVISLILEKFQRFTLVFTVLEIPIKVLDAFLFDLFSMLELTGLQPCQFLFLFCWLHHVRLCTISNCIESDNAERSLIRVSQLFFVDFCFQVCQLDLDLLCLCEKDIGTQQPDMLLLLGQAKQLVFTFNKIYGVLDWTNRQSK